MDAAIWISGNVGSEITVREFANGGSVANFRLACTPRIRRGGEWGDDETTWLHVVCTRALATNVKSSIGKGDPVIVVGRLRTERWSDDQEVQHERIKLQASAIGHDLSRGTSVFRRSTRTAAEEEHDPSLAEMMIATEEESDDAATGSAA